MTTPLQLNRSVSIDEIGQLVQHTAQKLYEGEWEAAHDQFTELHDRLFIDDAQQPEPQAPEYQQGLTAFQEKWEQNGKPGTDDVPTTPPADYLILQDDDLTRSDRSEAETLELLHQVQKQILDGEKEPAAFLEAMELMYRISHQYTAASEQAAQRAEQAEARLVALMQQNQHLLGVLNLISQGTDRCTPQYSN